MEGYGRCLLFFRSTDAYFHCPHQRLCNPLLKILSHSCWMDWAVLQQLSRNVVSMAAPAPMKMTISSMSITIDTKEDVEIFLLQVGDCIAFHDHCTPANKNILISL
ncbi:hypothetical protein SAY87_023275 [Trapa incisa]|uniref:Uncharacterized protein n=1 Tax=Trapa incisa TaxID=236973 RepID=A0AAN7Q6W3_9MYRT|nr:hypothetical protein SAY87_023275 [Trapa incisa]